MIRRLGRVGTRLSLVIVGGLALGCGDDPYQTASVTGTVLCDGKPAYGGTIRFRPIDAPQETGRPPGQPGRDAFATVEEDGTFELFMDTPASVNRAEGALIGRHQVFFDLPRTEPWKPSPEERMEFTPEELEELKAEYEKLPVYDPIPCGRQISPSEVTVEPGTNQFEFSLSPN